MGVLSDSAIRLALAASDIVIKPFNSEYLNSASYDVCLHNELKIYNVCTHINRKFGAYLDPKNEEHLRDTTTLVIPEEGLVLHPGVLYLGSTVEYTETHKYLPLLNGKSSIARLGMTIHITAGQGDIGFCGNWTLEIMVVHPLKVYPGMKIGQLVYEEVVGEVLRPYGSYNSKYQGQGIDPQPSKSFIDLNK